MPLTQKPLYFITYLFGCPVQQNSPLSKCIILFPYTCPAEGTYNYNKLLQAAPGDSNILQFSGNGPPSFQVEADGMFLKDRK